MDYPTFRLFGPACAGFGSPVMLLPTTVQFDFVGIGIAPGASRLLVLAATLAETPQFQRSTTDTANRNIASRQIAISTGDMTDGFGPVILFQIRDTAGVDNNIGQFGAVRDGADNSGAFVVATYNAGTPAERLRVDKDGLVTIANATMIRTTVAFTNGAAAQVGTLNNAPVAGNPTKWIPVNDNGTTRYIPAW